MEGDSRAVKWMLDGMAALARRLPPVRGRGTVAHWLRRATRGAPGGAWRIPLAEGGTVTVPRRSEQGWTPAFTGHYEPVSLWLADRCFAPNTFALDLGACFGMFAVPLGVMARERRGRVVAFEPVPSNARWLRRNVAANGLEELVEVHEVGLSDAPAQVEMRTEDGWEGNAVVIRGALADERHAHVAAGSLLPLDQIEISPEKDEMRCSFVKMDLEGFELYALRGADRFITRHRPLIFGEFNSKFMKDFGLGPDDVKGWTDAHDYRIFRVERVRKGPLTDEVGPRVEAVHVDDGGGWQDLLLVPDEQSADWGPS